jgi:hypothetical protein
MKKTENLFLGMTVWETPQKFDIDIRKQCGLNGFFPGE